MINFGTSDLANSSLILVSEKELWLILKDTDFLTLL